VLVQGREVLRGVNADTGENLWQAPVPSMFGMNILTPLAAGNRVFTSNLSGSVLIEIGANQPSAVTTVWNKKLVGEMSSPVLVDDHLYTHQRNGALVCLELANGNQRWSSRTSDSYISLVAQGKRILALTDSGRLRLMAANPEKYELLAEIEIAKSSTWAHLAVSDDRLLVRDLKGLTVYRWNNEPQKSETNRKEPNK
jgi:outer membrane protein assembly factor BamB